MRNQNLRNVTWSACVPQRIGLCLLLWAAPLHAQSEPSPAVIVQVKFKPGAATQWKEAFEQQIVPAIREAIEQGDQIMSCRYFENLVAGQSYDFVLILEAKTFAFFDRRQPYPHYRALFRRLGPGEAKKLLATMDSWEADVRVTLVRSYGIPKK